jgi:uncharacterized membrane protein YsdA (DUF1294 family)
MTVLLFYITAVNLYGFLIMGHDKSRSRKQGWRVPEKRLFTIAAVGGALGIWAGMKVYRHKTKHLSFVLGIPALFVLNIAIGYVVADALKLLN